MIVEHARTLWIKLTDPLESVTDGYMRQVARGSMVASLVTLIAILLLGSLRLFYDYATDTDITRIASHLIFIAVIVPTLATTYVLARHGALIAVIIILIVVVTLAIYVGALVGGAVKYGFYVSAVPIVLVVFTLPPVLGRRLLLLYLVELVLLSVLTPGLSLGDMLFGAIAFNGLVGGVALIVTQNIQNMSLRQRRALEASETRYRDLIDNLSDIVYVNKLDGEITSLNAAFERILGYPCADWIGKNPTALIHPDDIARGAGVINAMQKDAIPRPLEVRVRRRDGLYIWIEFRSMPLRDECGVTIAVTGVARDISIQKVAEDERVKRAVERERQAIIRQFVDSFSHYFRNALASISASVEVSQRMLPPEAQALVGERFGRIVGSIQAMGQQLDSLHMVTSLSLKSPIAVDVVTIAEGVIPTLALSATQKGIRLFWLAQPAPLVRANVDALTEAIRNLLVNALQHTPRDGDVTLTIWGEVGNVYISVRDTGDGMTSEQIALIFDPFYRIEAERGIDGGGIGLGLTMVRMVAEACGGEVRVESSPGAGSTFTLVLPAARD